MLHKWLVNIWIQRLEIAYIWFTGLFSLCMLPKAKFLQVLLVTTIFNVFLVFAISSTRCSVIRFLLWVYRWNAYHYYIWSLGLVRNFCKKYIYNFLFTHKKVVIFVFIHCNIYSYCLLRNKCDSSLTDYVFCTICWDFELTGTFVNDPIKRYFILSR